MTSLSTTNGDTPTAITLSLPTPTPPTSVPSPSGSSASVERTNSQRIVSASVGALLTSLCVTPFDVIKIRLQAQRPINGNGNSGGIPATKTPTPTPTATPIQQSTALRGSVRAALKDCSHYHLHTGLIDVWCRKCDMTPPVKPNRVGGPPLRFNGSLDAAIKLVQHEGVTSLWRGLAPTLVE
jgi:solute carrier family 25 protein 39/40